ncbi:MAG: hypothetical protein LBS03_05660 [Bacteroidales bacterium]|jgi:hypothetical protein|nr:hypothetical protein [Bacteroidales bacterium]
MQNKVFGNMLCAAATVACFLSSCRPEFNSAVLARVHNKYLYLDNIKYIFHNCTSREDSMTQQKMYVEKWIETQLLLNKAELNLPKEQLNISKEMESYRASLLIYKYENYLIHEKMDTVASEKELQDYYARNGENFLLDEYAVKLLCVQLPADAPDQNKVRKWYASDNESDFQDLIDYSSIHAVTLENFNDNWVRWSDVLQRFQAGDDLTRRMISSGRIEWQQDRQTILLMNIKEKKAPGEPAPLSLVKEKITEIILNKRKVEFIRQLETKIYNDASAKKQFEIY